MKVEELYNKVDLVNMRAMRTGWSKLLNQQDKILLLTKRGKIIGFYIPYLVARDLPNELKVLFMHLLNVYTKKAVPELEEIAGIGRNKEAVKLKGKDEGKTPST